MVEKRSIEDIISLVEQNFMFLHAGKFLSYHIKQRNLSLEAKNLLLVLKNNDKYLLRGDLIRNFLSESFLNWDKPNILDYFVEWNAFRGIAMAMHEGIARNPDFENFLKNIFKEKYLHFKYIIEFIRNVLSHNIDNEIRLINEDFSGTADKVKKNIDRSGVATLDFQYNRDFPEKINFPENYGFKIEVFFCDLKEGDKFIEIISEWQLFMLMELCNNVVFYNRKI
ncbi:MAG: hypothetical protein HZA95_03305 [Candidatus Vogelbacteria bacterium]|nr:hypothetical protein [Candidatus Vogelbacteria bacterium]